MLESLLPETENILGYVAAETGARIRLVPAEAGYLSRAKLSSRKSNQVTIAYNPSSESSDYAVAHEAVRYLRFMRAPPEERHLLASSQDTRLRAYKAIEQETENHPWSIREPTLRGFEYLYEGILTQLVSTPGDFWINCFLKEQFPEFENELTKGADAIFNRAHPNLSEHLQLLAPPTIYRATNGMNAAFALYMTKLLGNEKYADPYLGTEFEQLGEKLRSHNQTDRKHPGDKETADKWAEILGLKGWYRWILAKG
ncbi:MAG: hypothetical protein HY562_00155 [Ignavibacteriales bacterium]|nr:hypothetical protein [Ignavibacteriales bacterium]